MVILNLVSNCLQADHSSFSNWLAKKVGMPGLEELFLRRLWVKLARKIALKPLEKADNCLLPSSPRSGRVLLIRYLLTSILPFLSFSHYQGWSGTFTCNTRI